MHHGSPRKERDPDWNTDEIVDSQGARNHFSALHNPRLGVQSGAYPERPQVPGCWFMLAKALAYIAPIELLGLGSVATKELHDLKDVVG